ncbi:hypothetical protein CEY12_06010 [Chryseobacterium sp. T16E-39]|nr:hypothetical protein CEY12_06010 [Chryseobacterium sp. T16E-39]
MTIDTYFTETINKRKEIVNKADLNTAPFWLRQLKTAITIHSPIGLSFLDNRLGDEYWLLISKN